MVNYTKTDWTKASVNVANGLSNIENGIMQCASEINNLPAWVRSNEKPSYSAEEVGALIPGELVMHEISGTAHHEIFDNLESRLKSYIDMRLSNNQNVQDIKVAATSEALKSDISNTDNEILNSMAEIMDELKSIKKEQSNIKRSITKLNNQFKELQNEEG